MNKNDNFWMLVRGLLWGALAMALFHTIARADTDTEVRVAMAMANAVKPTKASIADKPIDFDLSSLERNIAPARTVPATGFPAGSYNADHTCPACRTSYASLKLFGHKDGKHWHKCVECGARWWHADGPDTIIRK